MISNPPLAREILMKCSDLLEPLKAHLSKTEGKHSYHCEALSSVRSVIVIWVQHHPSHEMAHVTSTIAAQM